MTPRNDPQNKTTDSTKETPAKILVVGSMNMDYVLQTERLPHKGETLPAKNFSVVFGGKGMNQSVAIKRLGGESLMIGCLGKDSDGDSLLQGLEKEGLSPQWIDRSQSVNTGIAFITVSDQGDNTIVVHPGSNHALSVDWVQRAIQEHQDATMLVLQMEIPLEVITSTIEAAYAYGIPVVLNPSPYKEIPRKTLEKVHTLVVNEVEAEQVAASLGYIKESEVHGTEDPQAIVALLAKSKIPQIILTKGDQGVYYNEPPKARDHPNKSYADADTYADTEAVTASTESEIPVCHQEAKSVSVVDPTAAGDSFLGAYVAGRCRGYSLDKAIAYGILAGALAVTKAGAQPSIPSAEDMKTAGWVE